MKLVLIGPGFQPIPPVGWGAVESLIWDYYTTIKACYPEIDVEIVNECEEEALVSKVNASNPDIVHLHYDDYILAMKRIKCKHIILTSHYGYLPQINIDGNYGYKRIFSRYINSGFPIFCLSPEIQAVYEEHGVDRDRLYLQPNGANETRFRYSPRVMYPDRSIYLAKIEPRKRQFVYQDISGLYFAGRICDTRFTLNSERYLNELSKEELFETLTDYANLVLLSDGEAHPLVCCEALICGLGLVVSEFAAANLDTTLPFIDVIPTEQLHNVAYISHIIEQNRAKSVQYREQIREYGLTHFSWKPLVKQYIERIQRIIRS